MATKKKTPPKQKQITLFFETKEDCTRACAALNLSLRKVADINRTHNGNYSKTTGHYGLRVKNGNVLRVSLGSKLMIDEELFETLSEEQKRTLGHCDVTSIGWIAP